MEYRLQILSEEFALNSKKQNQQFKKELLDREERYFEIREEKIKLEEDVQESMDKKEEDMLKHIR